jgi:acylglycerol lipase
VIAFRRPMRRGAARIASRAGRREPYDAPMTPSTTSTTTAGHGTTLLTRTWPASGAPWASVLIVHGIAEHSGRYETVGRQLADAGIEAHSYDLRGFGASGGRRAYVDAWREHHDDLEARLLAVREASAGRPVALFGHSLGGLLALGYVVADPPRERPDALVLSAPALESNVPGWKRRFVRLLSSTMPRMSLANGFDGGLLSRDPAVGIAYLADPLNLHRTSTRLGAEALAEQARVLAALDRLAVPTLVYHGEGDRLVPTAASGPLEGRPGVIRRTWPGLRHESHNEPEGPAVIESIISWLRSTFSAADGQG